MTAEVVVKTPHPDGGLNRHGKPKMASRTVHLQLALHKAFWGHDRTGKEYRFI
jgi:hypothetical protein